jgi:hypothetical protein
LQCPVPTNSCRLLPWGRSLRWDMAKPQHTSRLRRLTRFTISTFLLGATGCTSPSESCVRVQRKNIPALAHGGKLRLIQINRMPTRYWYRARCSVNRGRLSDCHHNRVTGVTDEELQSVSDGLNHRPIVMPGAAVARCATITIFVRNG